MAGTNPLALAEVSTNLAYNFLMESNWVAQANFITNPFTPVVGAYAGLFYETNGAGIRHESAGFFTVKVSEKASYSGKLVFDGDAVSMSGKFNLSGRAQRSVSRAKKGKVDVNLNLELDWGTGSQQIRGTLSDGNWTASMLGDRATFGVTNPAVGYVGRYTFLLPRGGNYPVETAGGMGYGLVTNNVLGAVTLSGGLGDGAKLSQKVGLSKDGHWAMYAPLYKRTNVVTNLLTGQLVENKADYRGSVMGWVTFTNQKPEGVLSWVKTSGGSNYLYAGGFTNVAGLMGSLYVPPSGAGVRALNITNGMVTFSEGNLLGPIAYDVSWGSNNVVTVGAVVGVKPTFSVAAKTGLMKGSFPHPQNGNAITPYLGALLQSSNYVGGYFLGTDQSGLIKLQGN
jgi:hypothetical protein